MKNPKGPRYLIKVYAVYYFVIGFRIRNSAK